MTTLSRFAISFAVLLIAASCGDAGPEMNLSGKGGTAGADGTGADGIGGPLCGNAVMDAGESCDPPQSCPSFCDDGNSCTVDTLLGSTRTCDVTCSATPIYECTSGDGCCPEGCDAVNDSDCSASCGNGTLEAGETCDPPGSCPSSCDDGDACTTNVLTGSAANCNVACSDSSVLLCEDGDGCCPDGCNANSDDDCSPTCNNGVVEQGETCDPPGSCPSCNDGNACTVDSATGNSATCNVQCSNRPVDSCVPDDGCCPAGCSENEDSDCPSPSPMCGGAGPATTALDSEEQSFLQLLNQHRADNGRSPVSACTSLNRAAQGHSEDMRDEDYFDHDGLNGSSPISRACDACYLSCESTGWGENIAAGTSDAQGTFNQWVNSPGHNDNMLGSSFVVVGIGRATGGGRYGSYWTTVFGGKSDSSCN